MHKATTAIIGRQAPICSKGRPSGAASSSDDSLNYPAQSISFTITSTLMRRHGQISHGGGTSFHIGMVGPCSSIPTGHQANHLTSSQMPLGLHGYGAYFQGAWLRQSWLPHQALMDIQWKELYAIVVAAMAWGNWVAVRYGDMVQGMDKVASHRSSWAPYVTETPNYWMMAL